MAANFESLSPQFLEKLYKFIDACSAEDIPLDFDQGFISIKDQAMAWRQSRSDSEIDAKIAVLRGEAPFLAHLLSITTSKLGPHVTDDLPGCSWHNWGEAYTFHIVGQMGGALDSAHPAHKKIAEIAKEAGLVSGYSFKPKQPRLLQLSNAKSPLERYSLKEIDKIMEERHERN